MIVELERETILTFTRRVWRKDEWEFIYNGMIHERGLWIISMKVKLRKLRAAEHLLAKWGDLRGRLVAHVVVID